MIDKILHYSLTNPATVYDEEALTALELAGRTAAKVNECIEQVNENTEALPGMVTDEVQEQIDNGTFEKQIDKYAGELTQQLADHEKEMADGLAGARLELTNDVAATNARMDNVLGSLSTGGTTADAELIDIRVGMNGLTYESAGAAVRRQMKRYMRNYGTFINGPARLDIDLTANIITLKNTATYASYIFSGTMYATVKSGAMYTLDISAITDDTYHICFNKDDETLSMKPIRAEFAPGEIILFTAYMRPGRISQQLFSIGNNVYIDGVSFHAKTELSRVLGVDNNIKFMFDNATHTLYITPGYLFIDNGTYHYNTGTTIDLTPLAVTGGDTLYIIIEGGEIKAVGSGKLKNRTCSVILATWVLPDTTVRTSPDYTYIDAALQNRVYVDGNQVWGADKMPEPKNKTTAKIFRKVVCCGDSYTEGYMTLPDGTVKENNEEYAWPHYMETATGNKWVNAGHSGTTVLTWQTASRGYARAKAAGKTQAYIVGLQLNDVGKVDVGTNADIGTNAQTYYGGLSQIVTKLAALSPQAKIFLLTTPNKGDVWDTYNQAVRDVAAYYKGTYATHCLDLVQFQALYQTETIKADYDGHYTAVGYEQLAENMMAVLSDYINDHISEFRDVPFIEYD